MKWKKKSKPAIWTQAGFKNRLGVWRKPVKPNAPHRIKRTPLRRVSKRRARSRPAYRVAIAAFLARPENQRCRVFPNRKADDVHHMRGRAGKLEMDERWWLPVSRAGHIWIDNHMDAAREKGWLCARGKWNVWEA